MSLDSALLLWTALHSCLEQLCSTAVPCEGVTAHPEIPRGCISLVAEKLLSVTKFRRLIESENTSLKGNLRGHYADPLLRGKFGSAETNPDRCFSNLSSKKKKKKTLVWRFHSFPWASNSMLQYFRLRKIFLISNWSLFAVVKIHNLWPLSRWMDNSLPFQGHFCLVSSIYLSLAVTCHPDWWSPSPLNPQILSFRP